MGRLKTHSGAKKRFKVLKSGRVKRQRAGRRHLLEHKPSRRTRRLKQPSFIHKANWPAVKEQLGL